MKELRDIPEELFKESKIPDEHEDFETIEMECYESQCKELIPNMELRLVKINGKTYMVRTHNLKNEEWFECVDEEKLQKILSSNP